LVFFAEDTFGDQFAWDGKQVLRFLAETGQKESLASDIEGWLLAISSDPARELGLETLENWTKTNGPVPPGNHLFPRTPLIAGGSLVPSEIVLIDPFENMRFKGNLARQIADVPDGAKVELVVGPAPPDIPDNTPPIC
jgi:hypothetical protein